MALGTGLRRRAAAASNWRRNVVTSTFIAPISSLECTKYTIQGRKMPVPLSGRQWCWRSFPASPDSRALYRFVWSECSSPEAETDCRKPAVAGVNLHYGEAKVAAKTW